MQTKQHVVIERNTPGRWYDNPDISDFMFAMFGRHNSSLKHPSLCLHTYDKASKKGLNRFELRDGKWKPTELVEDLSDRIIYHPILTVSTTDPANIKTMLDAILNGIDGVNGSNGVPSVIIIPILMHKDHFGTIAIKPAKDGQKAAVYYFNSLGTMSGYSNEEAPIFEFMKNRYGLGAVVSNSKEQWQTDGNQCGPYTIWFVQQISRLVAEGNLNTNAVGELLAAIWKMGIDNEVGKTKATQVRAEHAGILEGLNTNFSTSIFLDFRLTIKRNPKWYENHDSLSFENLALQDPWDSQKTLYSNQKEVRDCGGVDAFELQEGTQKKLLDCLAEFCPVEKKRESIAKKPASYNWLFITAACVASGGALGTLASYTFKASPNIRMLQALASCFSPSKITTDVIINSAVGSAVGLIAAGIGYYGYGRGMEAKP